MKKIKYMKYHPFLGLLVLLLFGCKSSTPEPINMIVDKPRVSFTFDDGITNDIQDFKFEDWNGMILSHLDKHDLKAILFVKGDNKIDDKGQYLLKLWNDAGHRLANHTFSHPNFNSKKNNVFFFEQELLKTDSILSKFNNGIKLFRFPYLKEGGSTEKADSIRNILANHGYSNGYVTIDASDWYVNQRLIAMLKKQGVEKTDLEGYKKFYLDHIMERAKYYEKLSYELNERHIDHTLLLHHNLTSALFLGELIQKFKQEGWEVVDADKAYNDSVFKNIPNLAFAGESLIWSMAKQSGKYDSILRYPAEDGSYEKEKMDKLGL